MASSDNSTQTASEDPGRPAEDVENGYARRAITSLGALRSDGAARWVFIWPTVLLILFISIFPLIGSLALSLSHLVFQQGGLQIDFVGLANYTVLFFGTERTHFLGLLRPPNLVGLAIFAIGAAGTVWLFVRAARSGVSPGGLAIRLIAGVLFLGFLWLCVQSLASQGGRPGSLVVTFIFVFAGITLQYVLGLGLALLALQRLPFRRFFRVAFLIPLTITPVGIGYMFLMMTDTSKGPFEPCGWRPACETTAGSPIPGRLASRS